MQTFTNKSLKEYNTFGIDVKARKFISVETVEELKELLKNSYASELFVLGGGSNMLLTGDIEKTVVHINLEGIRIKEDLEDEVLVEAMAGENWHQFVLFCLDHGFGGLENLSLIPGNVGTAPIQNIGAYGVEIKDTFEECTALDVQTLELKKFSLEDCRFGYRDSIFKNSEKGRYIITQVTFRLTKNRHLLHTDYGSIGEYLAEEGIENPGIRDVSNAVISIRRSKLPDPKKIGNSGSFFKNPVISNQQITELQEIYPEMPFYKVDEEHVKVPAGWLIDRAGLKGYREGDAGVHTKQALVLVNYGNATGQEILRLSEKVQERVYDLFKVKLQPEVNIF
ncbi:UDP-N-acetylmuramate dehydrogenase [Salinimicrobium gaetbulicola]|uniref:UDP-N-acetylenolpyruvoylglucosamine reductase n=1 Tax=Salinimicrobium gaetbulicola TaxID=999702 RepID=A0ABW3IE45_9FLAO